MMYYIRTSSQRWHGGLCVCMSICERLRFWQRPIYAANHPVLTRLLARPSRTISTQHPARIYSPRCLMGVCGCLVAFPNRYKQECGARQSGAKRRAITSAKTSPPLHFVATEECSQLCVHDPLNTQRSISIIYYFASMFWDPVPSQCTQS